MILVDCVYYKYVKTTEEFSLFREMNLFSLLFRTLVHGNDFETLSSTKYTKYAKILDTPVSSKGSKEPLLPACPPAGKVLTFPAGGQAGSQRAFSAF